jgi:putative flippase GtrA
VLSNIFVFRTEEQQKDGKTAKAFIIYAVVGVIGYFLTVGLTLLGTLVIGESGIWYLLLTCAVKGIVLIWNYIGRKLLVYRGK